jgi:hypothetical protein
MGLAGREHEATEYGLVLMNASDRPLDFHLSAGFPWRLLLDSSDPHKPEGPLAGNVYRLAERSAAVAIANIVGEAKEHGP